MAEVTYVSHNAPKLRLSAVGNRKELQFKDGVLRLDSEKDAEAVAELDVLLKEKPHLSQLIRKADKEAVAARLSAELRAKMEKQGTVKGGITGDALKAAEALQLRDQELLKHAAENGASFDAVIEAAEKATDGAITVPGGVTPGVAKLKLGKK